MQNVFYALRQLNATIHLILKCQNFLSLRHVKLFRLYSSVFFPISHKKIIEYYRIYIKKAFALQIYVYLSEKSCPQTPPENVLLLFKVQTDFWSKILIRPKPKKVDSIVHYSLVSRLIFSLFSSIKVSSKLKKC